MKKTLTKEYVNKIFNYKKGVLYWNIKAAKKVKVGDKAGYLNKANGYLHVSVDYSIYRIHRLIYLYHHGYIPKIIDHIDGNKTNNSIENLRECTQSQNMMNSKLSSSNTSGVKGVFWNKRNKRWIASIRVGSDPICLGRFKSKAMAIACIEKARKELHGEFANHG